MSGELRFTSSPSSVQYRDNWDRVFGNQFPHAEVLTPFTSAERPGPPTPVVERPGPYLSPLDGDTGLPFPCCSSCSDKGTHCGRCANA